MSKLSLRFKGVSFVLGWLFRQSETSKVKTNLMLFLHPVILKDAAMSANYTSDKYNYIRGEQMRTKEEGVALMSDDVAPVLPEIKEFLKLPEPYKEPDSLNSPGVLPPASTEEVSVE